MTTKLTILPFEQSWRILAALPEDNLSIGNGFAFQHDESRVVGFTWFSKELGVPIWFGSKDGGKMWEFIKPDFWGPTFTAGEGI